MAKSFKLKKPIKYRKKKFGYKKYSESKASIARMPGLQWPDRIRVRLRYEERASFTMTSGALAQDIYRASGPRDPYQPSGGKNCMGWLQYAAMYQNYRCYGSTIRMTILNTGSNAATGTIIFCIVPTTSTSTIADIDNSLSIKYSKRLFYDSQGTSKNVGKSHMTIEKLFGVSHSTVQNEDDYQALISADPTNQIYWHVLAQPADQATTSTVIFYPRIDYDVEFFNRTTIVV